MTKSIKDENEIDISDLYRYIFLHHIKFCNGLQIILIIVF